LMSIVAVEVASYEQHAERAKEKGTKIHRVNGFEDSTY